MGLNPFLCNWILDFLKGCPQVVRVGNNTSINQSNVFIKPSLHQLMSQSDLQKPSLKPQTASNAGVEARWLGKTP
jgi:hypothetical protein